MTAIKEAGQGFALKIEPLLLCTYEVDCEDIEDLTDAAWLEQHGASAEALTCGWLSMARTGRTPPTWLLAEGLKAEGSAGVIVPSFAPGAEAADRNLVLWTWGDSHPHRVTVHDPSGRLPKDQLSWK